MHILPLQPRDFKKLGNIWDLKAKREQALSPERLTLAHIDHSIVEQFLFMARKQTRMLRRDKKQSACRHSCFLPVSAI
jgi:hypothetical protein